MNHDEVRALVNQASFLNERRADNWIPAAGAMEQQIAHARLARWCQLAAGGDWAHFLQRLAWDGLATTDALPLLTDGRWPHDRALPSWGDIVAAACALPPVAQEGHRTHDALLEPFVTVAQCRLAQRVATRLTWLTAAAQLQLADYLRQQLVALATPSLDYLASPQRRGMACHAPTLGAICQTFPVLARQLATKVSHWVEACAEFLERLAADWPRLAAQAGWRAALAAGVIIDLRPGLSDPHNNGRTVWAVTIAAEHGLKTTVAYKPKTLTLDWAWNELLAWCNKQGLTPALGHLWTLPRTDYGWMAWVAGEAGVVRNNSERYYQRVGMVLGLLHLLHATDCHAENLVTVGDQLLLVDAEMVRYPQIVGQEDADPLDVMRTGLLPRWTVNTQGVAEIGGSGGNGDLSAAAGAAIIAGYQRIMRFLTEHWCELCAATGPLTPFQGGEVRFGPRPTAAYLRLLDHLRQPALLRNGADFTIAADQLARTYLQHPAHAPFWPLLVQEQAALTQGDVPRFTVQVGQADFVVGRTRIAALLCWPVPALPSAAVQQQQQQLIRESLQRTAYFSPTRPSSKRFLTQAIQLGELLWQRAVPLGDGAVGWIAPQWQQRAGCYQHGFVGDDFYTGRAGIALFLAALYRATDDRRWRERALAALTPCAATPATDDGGRLYVFSQCAQFLQEPQLYQTAEQLIAQLLDTDSARADQRSATAWGVLDGKAGQLLGLLSFYRQLGTWGKDEKRSSVLRLAYAYGDALCAHQAAWLDPQPRLGGFAHGAAGVAYALAALYSLSGEQRFRQAAEQGWAVQQQLYDADAGNWQDRRGLTPVYLHNWCNGAAGIGLAAAASVAVLPALSATVERAAARLIDAPALSALDTICCGRFGQIESLLEMGMIMAQPTWIEHATAQARTALAQAEAAGHFQLYDDLPPRLFNPTFFRGVAGIGYTLLRLAAVNGECAGLLPCVLRWAANEPAWP